MEFRLKKLAFFTTDNDRNLVKAIIQIVDKNVETLSHTIYDSKSKIYINSKIRK